MSQIETKKNRLTTASLVLAYTSISSLVLIPIFFFIAMIIVMITFSGHTVGPYEPSLWEKTVEVVILPILYYFPIISAEITGILGLILGIIGIKKHGKQKDAIAGITISSITILIGIVILLIWMN